MAFVVTLASTKGGSGKSTLAWNLWGALRADGLAVTLVDLDPQGTLVDLAQLASIDGLEIVRQWPGRAQLEAAHPQTALFLVDTPGAQLEATAQPLAQSDAVLIPMRATAPDRAALWPMLKQLEAARAVNPTLAAAIVLTQTRHATKGWRDEIRATLEGASVPVLATEIAERVSYARSPLEGGTVFDTTDTKAQAEIGALALELAQLLERTQPPTT